MRHIVKHRVQSTVSPGLIRRGYGFLSRNAGWAAITFVVALVTVLQVGSAWINSQPRLLAQAPDITIAPGDVVFGSSKASRTVLAFVSMTCIHCRAWERSVLPSVIHDLVDTGEVRLVIRPFPLDQRALSLSAMVSCLPQQMAPAAQRYLLAHSGDLLGSSPSTDLANSGVPSDIATKAILCGSGAERKASILNSEIAARREYGVVGTPSFIVGRRLVTGEISEATLMRLLAHD